MVDAPRDMGAGTFLVACTLLLVSGGRASAQVAPVSTEPRGPMTSVAFSPDGGLVASASSDHNVYVWSAADGAPVRTLQGHEDAVFVVDFSPDGSTLVSSGYDGRVIAWDVATGEPLRTWTVDPWAVAAAFSPDGAEVVVGEADGGVSILSLRSGGARSIDSAQRGIATVAYSPAGNRIADAFAMIALRDPSTGAVIDTLQGHSGLIFSLAFTPDGRRIVSGALDATIRVWNLATGETVRVLETDWPAPFIAVSPDGGRLAAGGTDHKVFLWSLSAAAPEPQVIGEHEKTVTDVAFSPDGGRLATSSMDGTVKIWILGS